MQQQQVIDMIISAASIKDKRKACQTVSDICTSYIGFNPRINRVDSCFALTRRSLDERLDILLSRIIADSRLRQILKWAKEISYITMSYGY